MHTISFVFVLFFVVICDSYKIIIFVPGHTNSQLLFNYRFGDMLASHGHDVTLYVAKSNPNAKIAKPKFAKEFIFQAVTDQEKVSEVFKHLQSFVYSTDFSWTEYLESFAHFIDNIFIKGCETQLADKNLLKTLKAENFDLAISHMYDLCPMGIIKALEIPTYIWMSSGVLLDNMASAIGATTSISYVPSAFSPFSDRMNYLERMKNFFGVILFRFMNHYLVVGPETELFRKYIHPQFPNLRQLAAKSPLLFVNSEELLDFPRPILHKIIYIGGVNMNKPEPLEEKWQKVADDSQDGFVILSFGSLANASAMPEEWKRSFVEAFSRFPTYTFIWKYELPFPEASKYKNIITTKWVPQKDLLDHPKISALMTHCGYNSFLEAAMNGVPVVGIPLFDDQSGNRKRAERLGMGVGIDKWDITADTIEDALQKILTNSSYHENAQKIAKMLATQPFQSEDLAIRWVEYLAEFKDLSNLTPVSTELNFVQYFMVDVILTLIFILLFSSYVVLCTVRYVIRRICCSQKSKKRSRLGHSYSEK